MSIAFTLGLALLIGPPAEQPAVHFPTVASVNLEGKAFTMPADFAGTRNIVFVAFQMAQQADVDSWVPTVKQLIGRTPGLEYYELPTIKKMVAPMRWMINSGMKSGINDRNARDRTITLYIDKTPFKDALGITDETAIQVMLVERSGAILWRSTGRFTAEKGAALAAAVSAK